jgi:ligand-binding SRPBCC domain-containing protein
MVFDPKVHRRKSRPRGVYTFSRSVHIEQPVDVVFQFCLDGANFQRIAPNRIEPVPETDETIVQLNHVYPFRQWTLGIPMRWTMHVVELIPNVKFVDELLGGPMRYIRHSHVFKPEGTGTLYTDILDYRPYAGPLMQRIYVNGEMHRTFAHRQFQMKKLLESGGGSN